MLVIRVEAPESVLETDTKSKLKSFVLILSTSLIYFVVPLNKTIISNKLQNLFRVKKKNYFLSDRIFG